jgi:N-acyl-D-aspartate/D-glutamate deacylase
VLFELWAEGIELVFFVEGGAAPAALHLQDEASRARLLADPAYRERFRSEWRNRFLPRAFHRALARCVVLSSPDPSLDGKTFRDLARERGKDEVDTFLDLVVLHGPKLRWYTVAGNDRPRWLRWIVRHPDILMGFSDAGAHLRNMAHYNFPLRMLKLVRDEAKPGFMTTGRAVQRLTSELGDWLGLDAGTLAPGRRADVVVIDPEELGAELDAVTEEEIPGFGLRRLVRRNDRAVRAVLINGRPALRDGALSGELGRSRGFGRVLRAGE